MKNIVVKILSLSVILASAFSFAACNGSKGGEGDDTSAEPVGTVAPSNTPSDPATLPEIKTEGEPSVPEDTKTQKPDETVPQQTKPDETAPQQTKPETELSPITTPSAGLNPVIPPTEKASAAAETAIAQVGKGFKFGGASPEEGFDNSGLVYYALTQNGIKCPRTVKEMSAIGEKKTADQLIAGDIAFFNMDDEGKTQIVALYVGEGQLVISTDEDKPVKIADINSVWYKKAFAYGITPQG